MNDERIVQAIYQLRTALRAQGIRETFVIELFGPEDGLRLMNAFSKNDRFIEYGRMNAETGQPVNQVELAGTIVRWPAQKRAEKGGGFSWV